MLAGYFQSTCGRYIEHLTPFLILHDTTNVPANQKTPKRSV
jgi:hypothetical protein